MHATEYIINDFLYLFLSISLYLLSTTQPTSSYPPAYILGLNPCLPTVPTSLYTCTIIQQTGEEESVSECTGVNGVCGAGPGCHPILFSLHVSQVHPWGGTSGCLSCCLCYGLVVSIWAQCYCKCYTYKYLICCYLTLTVIYAFS